VTELSQHVEQFAAWPGRINPSINRTFSEARCDGRLSIAVWRGYRTTAHQTVRAMAAKTAVRAIEINSESAASLITK